MAKNEREDEELSDLRNDRKRLTEERDRARAIALSLEFERARACTALRRLYDAHCAWVIALSSEKVDYKLKAYGELNCALALAQEVSSEQD